MIVTQGDYPSVEGEFIDVETTEIEKGYEPPIHDFTIEQDGVDYAPELLKEPKLVMIISFDLKKSNYKAYPKVGDQGKE